MTLTYGPRWVPERLPGQPEDAPYPWALRDAFGVTVTPYCAADTWQAIMVGSSLLEPWHTSAECRLGFGNVLRFAGLVGADRAAGLLNARCLGPAVTE